MYSFDLCLLLCLPLCILLAQSDHISEPLEQPSHASSPVGRLLDANDLLPALRHAPGSEPASIDYDLRRLVFLFGAALVVERQFGLLGLRVDDGEVVVELLLLVLDVQEVLGGEGPRESVG